MRSSKIERALYGPSLFEVTLGAVLSVLLGAALAVVFMILKPVIVVKDPPKEEDRVQGAVYFVQGSADASRSRQWIRKRQMLIDGTPGVIAFSEEELNSWLSSGAPKKDKKPAKSAAKPATPPKPGAPKQAPEPEPAEDLLVLETPNVRIRDSVFQIGFPGSLNIWTFSLPIVLQSQGSFEKVDDLWMYKPNTFFLGSMPLHRIPGFTEEVVRRFTSSGFIPEDALNSWKRVSDVALEGKALKITIPAPNATAPEPAATTSAPAEAPKPTAEPTSAPTQAPSAAPASPGPEAPAPAPSSSTQPATTPAPAATETHDSTPTSGPTPAQAPATTPAPTTEPAAPTPTPAPAAGTPGT